MDGDNNEQGGDVDYDKIMAEQAAKLMASKGKGGPIQKKQPLLNKDKKKFDSADYFKEKEQGHTGEGEGEGEPNS